MNSPRTNIRNLFLGYRFLGFPTQYYDRAATGIIANPPRGMVMILFEEDVYKVSIYLTFLDMEKTEIWDSGAFKGAKFCFEKYLGELYART